MTAARAELTDCSHFFRLGMKGPKATEWLQQRGLVVPALPNSWRALDARGGVIARLGTSEFFIEQSTSVAIADIARELAAPLEGVYPVLREDRAFVLSGEDAEHVLAQMCNVDFENVSRADRHVVMTMMIGIAVLVIPQEGTGDGSTDSAAESRRGCYRIWCDPSYGDYLWSSLQVVMRGA